MTWRLLPAVLVLCLSLVGLSGAQTPRVVFPEVLPDRRVIVRFYAPQAREVRIFFERGGNSLSKRENGVWEATIGPLDPGSYRYGLAIDGAGSIGGTTFTSSHRSCSDSEHWRVS